MTHHDSDKASLDSIILKRDSCGRVRTTVAQRVALLAEYARSGLSGPAFARLTGINHQTFTYWRQHHGKAGAARPPARGAAPGGVRLVEATLASADGHGTHLLPVAGDSAGWRAIAHL